MWTDLKHRPDLLLLLSLLLLILLHPVLDHGIVSNIFLIVLSFVPVILATIRLSQIRGWWWQSLLLVAAIVIFSVANQFWPSPAFSTIKWVFVAVLWAYRGWPFLLYPECRIDHEFPPIYRSQHLFVAWLGVVCALLRCGVYRPGSHPDWPAGANRAQERDSVLQPRDPYHARLRRCCRGPQRSSAFSHLGGGGGRPLHRDDRRAIGRQLPATEFIL